MKRIALMTAVLFAVSAAGFARAEVRTGSQELGIHVGALLGDDLTDSVVSGAQPELGTGFVIGTNYTYNLSQHVGVEGRYTFNPNDAEDGPTGDIDMDLHLFDINAVYHFNPRAPVVYYGTAGIGWAFGDLDRRITGTAGGTPVAIDDDDGFTFNLGLGLKWEAIRHVFLRLDARYRYIDQFVDTRDDPLNTVEITAGPAWVF
ncbi:MAG: outer membrane beta-barrel protein [Nitrospiria bacterium]